MVTHHRKCITANECAFAYKQNGDVAAQLCAAINVSVCVAHDTSENTVRTLKFGTGVCYAIAYNVIFV